MRQHAHRERGAVLIVALLFLVMLTLLGVTAMTSTSMEERMSGNARDNSVAFQAAEAALRDAKRDLDCYPNILACGAQHPVRLLPKDWYLSGTNFGVNFNLGTCNTSITLRGLCMPTVVNHGENAQLPPVPNDANHSFTNTSAASPTVAYGTFTAAPALEGVAQQPRYLIELFCLVTTTTGISAGEPACNFYRVTAVGFGANPNTTVMLQEMVAKDPS